LATCSIPRCRNPRPRRSRRCLSGRQPRRHQRHPPHNPRLLPPRANEPASWPGSCVRARLMPRPSPDRRPEEEPRTIQEAPTRPQLVVRILDVGEHQGLPFDAPHGSDRRVRVATHTGTCNECRVGPFLAPALPFSIPLFLLAARRRVLGPAQAPWHQSDSAKTLLDQRTMTNRYTHAVAAGCAIGRRDKGRLFVASKPGELLARQGDGNYPARGRGQFRRELGSGVDVPVDESQAGREHRSPLDRPSANANFANFGPCLWVPKTFNSQNSRNSQFSRS
jgi:hypothetical protein